ncbi:MAG: hypothetical protein FWD26_05865 [Treponema sp.]|nr:hypothetical protein [Treponema sp.]
MALYYYLMAQLPSLFYDQKPPMSSQAFRELAVSNLNKIDADLMQYLSLEMPSDTGKKDSKKIKSCEFINSWRQWERTLRLNLARYRFLKLHSDETAETSSELPVMPADAYATAAIAFTQEGSPLDGEILLDKARWAAIDLMTGSEYFDRNNVFAYYLKLLLMERRQLFILENGFSEYKTLYAEIMESAQSYVHAGDDK